MATTSWSYLRRRIAYRGIPSGLIKEINNETSQAHCLLCSLRGSIVLSSDRAVRGAQADCHPAAPCSQLSSTRLKMYF